ncbi:MAG: polyphosphate kinase 1 [Aquirhabdus sp.]
MNQAAQTTSEIVEYDSNVRYLNRDLSLLDFHLRVLEQAVDPLNPVIERLNFLLIFSRNMDEFFEVRVAGLMQQLGYSDDSTTPDGMHPSEVLVKISETAHAAIERQYRILNEEVLPAMAEENIRFLRREELTVDQATWVHQYFREQVLPVLTPISLDPAHPFPRLVNKSLNFIVTLDGKDAFGRDIKFAIVPAPRSLPRVVRLPDHLTGGFEHHVMLSAIIHEHVSELFPGMSATGCHQFRVTRNADLEFDEDAEDVAKALKGGLSSRRFGRAVRLEVTSHCPNNIVEYLLRRFGLNQTQLYKVNGPVNLARLLSNFNRPKMRYKSFIPAMPPALRSSDDIFASIKKQDIGSDSEIVQILADAARQGKEVTAIIELRARFDEESNMEVANILQEAGAVVVYGIVGYKTHAKMILVVRREGDKLTRYVHLGTGNYHAGNARMYTDYGLLSANPQLSEDVHKIFQELTGMGKAAKLQKLLHAPFTLHTQLIAYINEEIEFAKAGKGGHIIVKVNALTERHLIDALYQASNAGVKVELIIRSTCCLRPQVKGLSENITVRSIVGRFLEHTRVFYFANGGESRVYCASADWMDRNLFSRVEVCFPIDNGHLRRRIIQQGLQNYLDDNQQAWELDKYGVWNRVQLKEGQEQHMAQAILLEKLSK